MKVQYRSDPSLFADTEALYHAVRKAEGRILTPDEVRGLPLIDSSRDHAREWRIRDATATRLIHHLSRKNRRLRVIDLGCGTGWIAARLASGGRATVVGIDCNRAELELGAEAFAEIEDLQLVYGNIFDPIVDEASFDAVLMVGALQYFPEPGRLIARLMQLLEPDGEILIAESPIHRTDEAPSAVERSLSYYEALGFPEMASRFHHHTFEELSPFSPRPLYDPKAFSARIGRLLHRPLSPFPVLRIAR